MITTPDLVDVGELRQRQLEDPAIQILDVRTGGEFETTHIPGSHNIPLDMLTAHVRDLADIDHPFALICQSDARSRQAFDKLTTAGKTSLCILEGGITAWQAAGGDVTVGKADRWAMDRQVRLVAGTIVLAGIAASIITPKAKWLAGVVGAGLTFSAVSNTCTLAAVLSKLPYNRTTNHDIQAILAQLNGEA